MKIVLSALCIYSLILCTGCANMGEECNMQEELGYWGYVDEILITCIVKKRVGKGYIFSKETFQIEKCPNNYVEKTAKTKDEARFPPTECELQEGQDWWLGWIVAGFVAMIFSIVFIILCWKKRKERKNVNYELLIG